MILKQVDSSGIINVIKQLMMSLRDQLYKYCIKKLLHVMGALKIENIKRKESTLIKKKERKKTNVLKMKRKNDRHVCLTVKPN